LLLRVGNVKPLRSGFACMRTVDQDYMSNSDSQTPTGFDRFGLDDALLRGIRDAGFTSPRPIQAETIPAGLDGRDVLGLAQTGTGKTAAFALPILELILADRAEGRRADGPTTLILAPTRELATQIAAEIRTLSKYARAGLITIYGGVSQRNQVNALRNRPEIVVGCPGRVLDLLQQGLLDLGDVETLVLDEADHMFDMGFMVDIRKILKFLPEDRQNLLFSATMPKEIRKLADEMLHDPHVVELAKSAPAATIDHALIMVEERRKRDLLEHVLSDDGCESAIVFTRTKHRAKRLALQLSKSGHKAVGLQGNMSQAQRDRAMGGFRTRKFNILVATDIVARGIDVSGVSHVINFDVPTTPEAYTHRIGRTGRAEHEGEACTFVTGDDRAWVRATERMIGAPIARRRVDGFEAEPERGPAPRRQARPAGRPAARTAPHSGGRSDAQRRNSRSDGPRRGQGHGSDRRRAR